MGITDRVKDVLSAGEPEQLRDPELRRMLELFQLLQRQGLVRRAEYDLPQRDTVGREFILSGLKAIAKK